MDKMTSAGGQHPYADVSGRMEVFGRLFGEQIGIPEPRVVTSTESLLAIVKARVPRDASHGDDAPVFEAAAFVGEWLRQRASALWVAEGPFEPHLQIVDETHAIVYLLPLVQLIRTASTAGYDGLLEMLDGVLEDVARPARPGPLGELRVEPVEDREAVIHWARANAGARLATRAALWRRCSVCARVHERVLTLPRPGDDWEGEAASAASLLASTPFACPCGGPMGAVSRFLMMRHEHGRARLGDIYVANTHTRVGCWRVEGDRIAPLDALELARDEMPAG